MAKTNLLIAAATVLLLGTAVPAGALDLSLGGTGVSAGNTSTGTGTNVTISGGGGPLASINLGGGDNSIASATVGDDLTAGIGSNPGDLVEFDGNNAQVNLGLGSLGLVDDGSSTIGDILDGLDLGDIGVPGGPGGGPGGPGIGGGGGGLGTAFAALSGGEQQFLRNRCRAVLANPAGFEDSVVALCRLIARL